MARTSTLIVLIVVLSYFTTELTAKARPLSLSPTLLARLKLDEEASSISCWDSLVQLQACTGEIILFFLNGETYLGHSCCEAIRIITKQCWPTMIDTLGFTTEEGDILEGYCDKADDDSTYPPSPPSLGPNDKAIAKGTVVP
ncbi:egg cell-secreted protein 1.1 [Ricinus communis]|uniref:Prolamin-like domain-containing protein n=1 Tax=Ricinus communis TaxID=3988 RepID=B9SE79_RICCO|nr:egg cell-secreted protein 1.1 [Ricinus communis]EEF38038.1 conserved hypothetical protein [Ricinus communis]|eukprot:XP_002524298.1 egg cell-secreted protein 1.1 [Ricinus communis]